MSALETLNNMHASILPPIARNSLVDFSQLCTIFVLRRSPVCLHTQVNFSTPSCKISGRSDFNCLLLTSERCIPWYWSWKNRTTIRSRRSFLLNAIRRESPYEILGVPPSANLNEIKRAYRRLALKYHPDVNNEDNAQEKFMRIKHAYNMLLNSDSRRKYESGSSYYSTRERESSNTQDDEFYGLENFFNDVQEEFRNWEANSASQGKPKSLWEELAEIGEEFVEFLEKEFNITDQQVYPDNINKGSQAGNSYGTFGSENSERPKRDEDITGKGSSIKNDIDEVEATLAKLKRELGL